MDKYIELEALRRAIFDAEWRESQDEDVAYDVMESVPAADVAPVIHGKWEFIGDHYANCTNCGRIFDARPTPYFFAMNNEFCRKCGARMDGDD